jgi:autotransporter-associated beta strand protein
MKFTVSATSAALLLAGAMSPAHAQPQKLRPGLWEHTVVMKSQSGQMEAAMAQMQKSLASLPPEQRKQMEQMMAQQGVSLGPKGNAVRMCITAEQADLDNIPPQEGCTQNVRRTGPNTVAMTFSCKGSQGAPPTSGEGTMTFNGPTAYTGNFKVNSGAGGKSDQIDMAQTGKWLSADCGAIKPVR